MLYVTLFLIFSSSFCSMASDLEESDDDVGLDDIEYTSVIPESSMYPVFTTTTPSGVSSFTTSTSTSSVWPSSSSHTAQSSSSSRSSSSHTSKISSSFTHTQSPTNAPPHSRLPFEESLILYVTVPALCLLVVIAFTVALVLCVRRYKRIRKYRLHLMPLHNMDGSDDDDDDNDEEFDEDDQEAAFTISSMGGRQPILQFAESV